MSSVIAAAAVQLAKSGEAAKAGPIGLAVILLLCIACYFLFKSMSKHMRNVRENFPGKPVSSPTSAADRVATADAPAVSIEKASPIHDQEPVNRATDLPQGS